MGKNLLIYTCCVSLGIIFGCSSTKNSALQTTGNIQQTTGVQQQIVPGDTILSTPEQENNCMSLKPLIQKDFDLFNSPNYQNNCTSNCDGMAIENKIVDVFFSKKNNTCYLGEERIGVEGLSYYEITAIQSTQTGYDYTGEAIFSKNCTSKELYLSSIDLTQLTGIELESDKREMLCDYASTRLETEMKNEIKKLKQ